MISKIKFIKAKEILDSRENPTLEVKLTTDKGSFFASAPSGASKGKYEAVALSAKKAIDNVNKIIAPKLIGKDPVNQKKIDQLLIKRLGANATTAVSLAVCRAGASAKNLPLYGYIAQLAENWSPLTMPRPCFNVINGGAHASNKLDIQEFMIVPRKKEFGENFQTGKEVSKKLKRIAEKKFGKKAVKAGDEGGLDIPLQNPEDALRLISKYGAGIILDCAASQFYKKGRYLMNIGSFSKENLADYYIKLIRKYPILGLEDPFAEEDWSAFSAFLADKETKNILIIGDDLTVTNPDRIKLAYKKKACNGVIIKINQIGTVTEAIKSVKLAKSYSWKTMVSNRSGETMDDFIADFAVGVGADFIKSGAPTKPERLSKYDRLLAIENELA